MTRLRPTVLSAVAALCIALPTVAVAAAPTSVTVADPRGDQRHGPQWDSHPEGRAPSDLLASRAVVDGDDLVLSIRLGDVARRSPDTVVILSLTGSLDYGRRGYSQLDLSAQWGGGNPLSTALNLDRAPRCNERVRDARLVAQDRYVARIPLSCFPRGARAVEGLRTDSLTWTTDSRTIGRDTSYRHVKLDLP